jgi:hypothetical protein
MILEESRISLAALRSIVGKCTFLSGAIPGARWFTRVQYWELTAMEADGSGSAEILPALREELAFWPELVEQWQGAEFAHPRHVVVGLHTDASSYYWGGKVVQSPASMELPDKEFGGPIPAHLCDEHIQVKEAFALVETLKLLGPNVRNSWIDVGIDNVAVLFAARLMRGRSRMMFGVLKQLAFVQRDFSLRLSYHYVPSKLNESDEISRPNRAAECSLSLHLWELVERVFGPHNLDLMATSANAHCGAFISRFACDEARGVNVLAQDLLLVGEQRANGYLFPPFAMVDHVLEHVWSQGATVTAILPYRPAALWWSVACAKAITCFYLGKAGRDTVVVYENGVAKPVALKEDLWCFRFDPMWSGSALFYREE